MSETPEKVPTKSGGKVSSPLLEEAWQPLARLRSDMERMVEDFFSALPSPFGGRRNTAAAFRPLEAILSASMPVVDLVEKDNAYELSAELPGMDERDVQISLRDDVLTISGEKKEETEEKKHGWHFAERRFGSFRRAFQLPQDVDAEKIEAAFKKGVLTITLPKNPQAAKVEKKIEIKAN